MSNHHHYFFLLLLSCRLQEKHKCFFFVVFSFRVAAIQLSRLYQLFVTQNWHNIFFFSWNNTHTLNRQENPLVSYISRCSNS
uniref:Uncharacterized protein n=1 Tax=Octopus bimaculoides TaxID=37653 RepID=A0A0L8G5N2_OCTBM